MGKLSSEKIKEMFMNCLFSESELTDEKPNVPCTYVKGITLELGFHKGRLEACKDELVEMIAELPDQFLKNKGGGWSFLNLCNDKDGNQWTSFHKSMEEFCCLCIGNGLATFPLPRDFWSTLPGGMPYVMFDPAGEFELKKAGSQ